MNAKLTSQSRHEQSSRPYEISPRQSQKSILKNNGSKMRDGSDPNEIDYDKLHKQSKKLL